MVCTHAITDRHAQTTAQDSAETHSTRRQEAVGYKKVLSIVFIIDNFQFLNRSQQQRKSWID